MKAESELCKICPLNDSCSPELRPTHSMGKRLVLNNPWLCQHLTCPAGVDRALEEKRRLRLQRIFTGWVYFSSPDKPNIRRFDMQQGIIESSQDGIWYSTGQSLYGIYVVKMEHYPFKRIKPENW